mmetsp:Transcript_6781/g.18168  ORF Transcript_6781/g.18168 Transcript_6781/m.18168 type:complete len:114 (+) Transcript_6781:354-695(+)
MFVRMGRSAKKKKKDAATKRPAPAIVVRSAQNARVEKVTAGKRGKVVSKITGIELDAAALKALLKTLKIKCGTGGTANSVDGHCEIEIQGEHVDSLVGLLREEGWVKAKRIGK